MICQTGQGRAIERRKREWSRWLNKDGDEEKLRRRRRKKTKKEVKTKSGERDIREQLEKTKGDEDSLYDDGSWVNEKEGKKGNS